VNDSVEQNPRILIVDDNRAIHEDFRKVLGKREAVRTELDALHGELFGAADEETGGSFDLGSAYQGEEAIEQVAAARKEGKPYALAFVDVRMPPGMDGVETTARLLEEDPELSVVICSAYSDHSWEEMARAIGKSDRVLILKKPFDTIEVRQLAHALKARWELGRLVALKLGDLTEMVEERTKALAEANENLKVEAAAREEAMQQLAESNEQIRELAYQDGLTNLPNRRLLNEYLEKVLARATRKCVEFAILFVDLDNFKLINDTIGHQAADEVLRRLADTLNHLIRSEDVFALYADQNADLDATISKAPITDSVLSRFGGDEFVILLPEIRDRFSAGAVARRVLTCLEQPFVVGEQEVFVSVSIGIATYPADGHTTDILIRNADTAMYHAKQQGKSAYQYYSATMNAASVERMTLEGGLRRALGDDQLELHYQPQIDVRTGAIIAAEALLRWNHPERGYVPPQTFIPIAEDTGLIIPIGEWVLERACRQVAEWQASGLPPIRVSVNVSAVQFRRQDLYELVRKHLSLSGIDPSRLVLEITESAIMSVRDRAVKPLNQLRELNVGLALDDFGTGYSSLSYLNAFPLTMLKIERSFVGELLRDKTAAKITEAIISMAHVLNLEVVAEGVEQSAQLEMLKEFGCDVVQGFYFSRAVPAAEFALLLQAGAGADPDIGRSGLAKKTSRGP
jgi:predicted signal transduction protein with EAL and GGDEF domain